MLERRAAAGRAGLGRRLPGGDPQRCAAEHVHKVGLGQSCRERGSHCQGQRAGLLAVREVGRVHDLLRRNAAEEVEDVDRAPDRGVEVDAAVTGEELGECREIGDPAVRDDELRLRVRLHEPVQVGGDRG